MPIWRKKKSEKKTKPKQAPPPVPAKPKFGPKPFVPPQIPEYFIPTVMPKRPLEKKVAPKRQSTDIENEFLKTFKSLTYRHRGWDIWNDFVVMAACALSNPVDKAHYEKREARYLRIIKKYNKEEQDKFPTLFAHTVMALEFNSEQDFLGRLYTQLGLQDEGRKQHFTPYSVCQLMADIAMGDVVQQVKENGYITLNDPCCGAGATLIAGVNCAKRRLEEACMNFQNHILVSGQDIDETVALMCYIQLSLLGVAAYIKVGNSLTEPMATSDSLENYWFTPMYFSDVWVMRRAIHQMDRLLQKGEEPE
ncbi:N-6 DNA methylase [Pseudoflavonifractor sp. 524-17]|uniref:N-6 DNA methylase n=1 Tax=Pseudoflavonifractor sp. 524-17 TaxID=2304577 RepID=UPI00325AD422